MRVGLPKYPAIKKFLRVSTTIELGISSPVLPADLAHTTFPSGLYSVTNISALEDPAFVKVVVPKINDVLLK